MQRPSILKSILYSLSILSLSFFMASCGDDGDDNTVQINGQYTLLTATFANPVDVDGAGPAPASTDAALVLGNGLYGTSGCTDASISGAFSEFNTDGTYNLVCKDAGATSTQVGNWTTNVTSSGELQIVLTNVTVPNPNYDDQSAEDCSGAFGQPNCQTISGLALTFEQVVFTQDATTGDIELTTVTSLPYDAQLNTERATLVLRKDN